MTKEKAIKDLNEIVYGMEQHGGYSIEDVKIEAERLIKQIDEI